MNANIALVFASLLLAAKTPAPPSSKPRTERIRTPDGLITLNFVPKATAADVGVPFYPRAKVSSGSCYTAKTADGKVARTRAEVTLRTRDNLQKVVQFYQKALADAQLRWEKPGSRAVLWKKSNDKVWIVTVEGGSIVIKHSASPIPIKLEEPRRTVPPRPSVGA